jgi:hypothetical protein
MRSAGIVSDRRKEVMKYRWGILACLLVAIVFLGSCGVLATVGDTAVTFHVENHLSQPIDIYVRYDSEGSYRSDFSLEPGAEHDTTIMEHRNGVWVQAKDRRSKVVYQQHFARDDPSRQPGQPFVVVVKP